MRVRGIGIELQHPPERPLRIRPAALAQVEPAKKILRGRILRREFLRGRKRRPAGLEIVATPCQHSAQDNGLRSAGFETFQRAQAGNCVFRHLRGETCLHQHSPVARFIGITRRQFFQNHFCLADPDAFTKRGRAIELTLRFRHRDGAQDIVARRRDVAELDKLFQSGLRGGGIFVGYFCGKASIVPGNFFPGRHARDRGWLDESVHQHLAFHVFADRQPEEREHRRRDIEQRRALDHLIRCDAGSGEHEHPLRSVPLRRFHWPAWPSHSALETVIRDDHEICFRTRQLNQPLEHQIVETVDARHHLLVEFELRLQDFRQPRWVEGHEEVSHLVDAFVIDRAEIPRLIFQQLGRGGMDRDHFGQALGEEGQAALVHGVGLVELSRARD